MEQYIKKSALIAKIERRISQLESKYKELSNFEVWTTAKEIKCKIDGLKEALSFVNTLEVKEINSTDAFIEKAIKYIANRFLAPGMDNEINDFVNYMKRE